MSEVASGLTGPEQFMRMGYGRINYFPNVEKSLERSGRERPAPEQLAECRRRPLTRAVSSVASGHSPLTIHRCRPHPIPIGKRFSTGCLRSTVLDPHRTARHCTVPGFTSLDRFEGALGRISGRRQRAESEPSLVPTQLHVAGNRRRVDAPTRGTAIARIGTVGRHAHAACRAPAVCRSR